MLCQYHLRTRLDVEDGVKEFKLFPERQFSSAIKFLENRILNPRLCLSQMALQPCIVWRRRSLLSQASHETRLCINTIDLPIGLLTEEKIQNRKAVMEASPLCCANGHFRLVIVLPATSKYLLIIEMINFISTPSTQRLLRYYPTICHVFTCIFSLSMYLVASWTTRTESKRWRKPERQENRHIVLICILLNSFNWP